MKRDMDLIRKILLHVEENDNLKFAIDRYEQREIAYHVRLLVEAELLKAVAIPVLSGDIVLQDTGHTALTWGGHEFLDAARDEGRWNKAKGIVKEKAGTVTVAAFTQLLVQIMKDAIGLP